MNEYIACHKINHLWNEPDCSALEHITLEYLLGNVHDRMLV